MGNKKDSSADNYKIVTWKSNRNNNRMKGSTQQLNTTRTTLPTESECTCKFSFRLHHDKNGFFIKPDYGNAVHSFHPFLDKKEVAYQMKLAPDSFKSSLSKLASAQYGAAHGRNLIIANEDFYLSRKYVMHLEELTCRFVLVHQSKKFLI
jgi:hypothetical protein